MEQMEKDVKEAIQMGCDLYVVFDKDAARLAQRLFEQHGQWKRVREGQLDEMTIATVGDLARNYLRGQRYKTPVINIRAHDHPQFSEAYMALRQMTNY